MPASQKKGHKVNKPFRVYLYSRADKPCHFLFSLGSFLGVDFMDNALQFWTSMGPKQRWSYTTWGNLSTYFFCNCITCSLSRYTYRVHQTIQMKLILLCVWSELVVVLSAKTALKFKYEIQIWNSNRLTHIQFNVWGRI